MKRNILTVTGVMFLLFFFWCDGSYKNYPPVVDPIPDQTVRVGNLLSFGITAEDPNGERIEFTARVIPDDATFSAQTGLFEWTPTEEDIGINWLVFEVEDVGDPALTTTGMVKITVLPEVDIPENHSPQIRPIPDQSGRVGNLISFTIEAYDIDEQDTITVETISTLPNGATFNKSQNSFSWTPVTGQNGSYGIVFKATDSGTPALYDLYLVNITVLPQNDPNQNPPVFIPIPYTSVMARMEMFMGLEATDPEGTAVSYACVNLPDGAMLDSESGTFTWTPPCANAGRFDLIFSATDSGNPVMTSYYVATLNIVGDLCPQITPLYDPSDLNGPQTINFDSVNVGVSQFSVGDANFNLANQCNGDSGTVVSSSSVFNSKCIELNDCSPELSFNNQLQAVAFACYYGDETDSSVWFTVELFDQNGSMGVYDAQNEAGTGFYGFRSSIPFDRAVIRAGDLVDGTGYVQGWIDDCYIEY